MRAHIRAAQADLLNTLPGERLSDQSVLLFRLGLLLLVVACGTFCATGTQTFTVIGLRLDVDCTELLIAAVLPDPVADQIELLSTSEDDFTRWAETRSAAPAAPGRGTKRRGLVALIAAGALAVYAGTRLHGDHDAKGTSDTSRPPSDTPSTGTSATHPTAGGESARGGNATGGNASGGNAAGGDATGGNATGGKTNGGSGGSGGSGGASGATSPKPPAPSGNLRLRNVGYGQCLAVTTGGVVFATCTDSPATNWTAKAGSGGSYMLPNESAGQCLTVNANVLYLADCGSKTGQNWRTGTNSTLVNLYSSLCLGESATWSYLVSCEPSKSNQHWAKKY
ncbi:ricin-type beta-trefoil lectin domain protein [Streptomyces sp. NPDC004728]|uniref:RICIN domain-containing protein n=1 Tax=Streptomyces sp. NPDC004728 TaxID=3154289 RepID=UPI0033BDBDC4